MRAAVPKGRLGSVILFTLAGSIVVAVAARLLLIAITWRLFGTNSTLGEISISLGTNFYLNSYELPTYFEVLLLLSSGFARHSRRFAATPAVPLP